MMQTEHVISDEAMHCIETALAGNRCWFAYNTISYFLQREDVYGFKHADQAYEFAALNIDEHKYYEVIYASSIADVFRQIHYGQTLEQNLIQSTFKNKIMDNENVQHLKDQVKYMGFNENQLKRTGFGEAFTPELKTKMEQGVPLIQHGFKKEYEGDEVTATLHLKKSATSDYYFLNKFDLQLQKEGQVNTTRQTFYITSKKAEGNSEEDDQQKNKINNKYTLKEAYNLLDGRPVYKNLVSKEGNEYEAWIRLNFKNKLENGNYEMKQYTKNYGFDLETVLSKYPIKELTNEQYRQSLTESLHRGNLQKVTFVDSKGNEEKLYVSPNIAMGSLNVYDENKQRLSTELLVEKQYIGKELAEQLKQHVSQQQKQEPTTAQKQAPVQSQKQEQKHKQVQKQKNGEPVKKQSRKQKVH